MALRLTTASAPKTVSRSPAELAALARTYLLRGDLDGYKSLFADAAGDADPHRRFRARLTLLECAMATLQEAPAKQVPALLLTAAREGIEILEQEPREPMLLNYTGVLLYELGALKPAEQLFKAAKRRDPDLPHVGKNLNELARSRRKKIDVTSALPPQVSLALPGLARRAEKVALAAKHAEGMKISLAMIVKDEEE